MFPFSLFKNLKPVVDSVEQLRVHVLWLLFIRVVLYTLLLSITFFLSTDEQRLILPPTLFTFLYILFIYVYSIGSALFLQKRNLPLKGFAQLQILFDTFFIALLVYATGCSQSIFTALFILPVVAGGLILYRTGGLITAAASTLLYAGLLTMEYLHLVPPYFEEFNYTVVEDFFVSMNIFAVYGLTFFLIAMLGGILARRLRITRDALTLTELKFDRLLLLYKQIFDDIMTGIITVDDRNAITSFNPAAADITGFSENEVLGRSLQDFFPQISAETSERRTADMSRKDGYHIRIGYSCSVLHMAEEPKLNDPECSNCKVITLQDISRIEQMEIQMRKAEKMAAIGELSASIAHDIRNPLAAISGSAQILSMELKDEGDDGDITHKSLMSIILRESDRLGRTITDFLDYARPKKPKLQWFNLSQLCQETIARLPEDNDVHCQIQTEIPEDLALYADRQLIQLALIHLLKNSCYASANAGEPVLLQAGQDDTPGDGGRYVIIEIRDSGIGIDPAIKDKLFDPFFSTREDTAGMGLAIVKQIVTNHFGTIEIEGVPDMGCTVLIRLPLPESTP